MIKRATIGEKIFDSAIYFVLAVLFVVYFVPLIYVVISSVTPYSEVARSGGLVIIPKEITLSAYSQIFKQGLIPRALGVTVFVTVVGTSLSMALSVLLAYPLSKQTLPGRKFILQALVFTMYFSGGLIPTYLIVRQMGMLNTVWAMIIPSVVSTYNVMLIRNYFQNIPAELFEAATIDGCGPTRSLLSIALPLSPPVLMTIMLFYMVSFWNTFYAAIYYINDPNLRPLQVILRDILNSVVGNMENVDVNIPSMTIQMASIVVTSVPIILVYPFIQKHFTKGIMMGAVKG
ncbi:carbohydrate ABC transporter permease [Ruminococcaceae bacterium OttesenSCG-928-L11]|nr:carbohydrate ABC transporter permease [Ruminococcaceae bacterium OttesenSCG-928-L11]